MVDLAAGDPPGAVHGQRQPAAGAARSARPARAAPSTIGRHRPAAGRAGRRRTSPCPSASAATGGRKRMTVPARPTSTVAGPSQRPRPHHPAVVVDGGDVRMPRARRPAAISSVSRARSGARSVLEGPSASAASTSARAVIDLEPGSRTVRGRPARWRSARSTGRGASRHRVIPRSVRSPICPIRRSAPTTAPGSARVRRWRWRTWRMCGRYATTRSDARPRRALRRDRRSPRDSGPSCNVAPTDPVPVVRISQRHAARVLDTARWGLVPPWATDPAVRRPHDQRTGRDRGHARGVRDRRSPGAAAWCRPTAGTNGCATASGNRPTT